jgi:hypothetical protein
MQELELVLMAGFKTLLTVRPQLLMDYPSN